jgi:predicted DNA-binding transcriptional regulator AlpA
MLLDGESPESIATDDETTLVSIPEAAELTGMSIRWCYQWPAP